jgi:hypothetical protein
MDDSSLFGYSNDVRVLSFTNRNSHQQGRSAHLRRDGYRPQSLVSRMAPRDGRRISFVAIASIRVDCSCAGAIFAKDLG